MKDVEGQIVRGNQSIIGLMVESHLNEGNQAIPGDLKDLRYGVSITDACVNWQTTEQMLLELHDTVAPVLLNRYSVDPLSTQQSA
jgi:3-deoxy-7-phosphoheptulonate synthase